MKLEQLGDRIEKLRVNNNANVDITPTPHRVWLARLCETQHLFSCQFLEPFYKYHVMIRNLCITMGRVFLPFIHIKIDVDTRAKTNSLYV